MADRTEQTQPRHPLAAGIRGAHHKRISLANQRAVLMLVATHPGITNAEIARRSGLGAQTVSRFLLDLEHAGLIRRGEVLRGQLGQPATPYTLIYDSVLSVGVEIGWRHADFVITDMTGECLAQRTILYDCPDPATIVYKLAEPVAAMCEALALPLRERVIGIGLSVPAEFHRTLAWLGASESVSAGWRKIDIAALVSAATGLDAYLYNNGNAACWAEYAGPRSIWFDDFAYVHISTFLASGIMTGHALLRGRNGRGAKLGRSLVGGDAPRMLHEVASLHALRRLISAEGLPQPSGPPTGWDWESLEPAAAPWIAEAGTALAWTALGVEAMTEVETLVIGGAVPPDILARLVAATSGELTRLKDATLATARVETGRAGPFAPAIGAAYLPVYERLYAR